MYAISVLARFYFYIGALYHEVSVEPVLIEMCQNVGKFSSQIAVKHLANVQ